jgi:hypothetical protein
MKSKLHEEPLVDRIERALEKDPELENWQLANRFGMALKTVAEARRKLTRRRKHTLGTQEHRDALKDSHLRFKERLTRMRAELRDG